MPRLFLILAVSVFAAVGTTFSLASASTGSSSGSGNSGSGNSGSGNSGKGNSGNAGRPEDPGANGREQADSKGDPQPDKGKEPANAHGNNDALPKAHAPESGKSVNVRPRRGTVRVKLPGTKQFVLLDDAASLPLGTLIDASHGALTLTAEDNRGNTDFATFSGAAFKVRQKAGAKFTTLVLRRPPCKTAARSTFGRLASPLAGISRKRRAGRKLWGSGKGRFRTRGRYGAATVRGTVWMTQNRCDGTLVRVKSGVVDVRDFSKKKTVAVETGERYLARKR